MKVSIGVVALNEEKTLPSLFEDFKMQTYPHDEIEIILVDGISTDNTKNIMQDFKENNDFMEVKILDNPKKIQSAGWNIVIKNFTGDVLVRIDAHSSVPKDFIEKNNKNIVFITSENDILLTQSDLDYIKNTFSNRVLMPFGGHTGLLWHSDMANLMVEKLEEE